MDLCSFFEKYRRVSVAFSGGVDSAYVLWAAKNADCEIGVYYVRSAFQPAFELADAKRFCNILKLPLKVLEMDVLSKEQIASNPYNRCYYCKHTIFSAIAQAAAKDGFSVLLDGTNASDDAGDRPGMQALTELSVLSPLRLCGVTKKQVREASKAAGLFLWDKPSYACLATRIPAGQHITAEDLQRIEKAENALSFLGFRDFRVRLFHDAARLQVTKEQMTLALAERENILQTLGAWFSQIDLDLNPRKAVD